MKTSRLVLRTKWNALNKDIIKIINEIQYFKTIREDTDVILSHIGQDPLKQRVLENGAFWDKHSDTICTGHSHRE